MASSTIDHIVIGAANLEKATKKVESLLKTTFSTSGNHVSMATHNRLLKLQNSIYMEIIATDPSASFPNRSHCRSHNRSHCRAAGADFFRGTPRDTAGHHD